MPRAGKPRDGGSDEPSSLRASRALCRTKPQPAKDPGLPQRAITSDFSLVCLYLSAVLSC